VPEQHHQVSHHGNDPDKIAKTAKINTYHSALFAKFLQKLRSTPDGDGSLSILLIVYGGGMGEPAYGQSAPRGSRRRRGQGQPARAQQAPAPSAIWLRVPNQFGSAEASAGNGKSTCFERSVSPGRMGEPPRTPRKELWLVFSWLI
jgi:hypothetical protein